MSKRFREIAIEQCRLAGTHATLPGYDKLIPIVWRKPSSSAPFSASVWSGGMQARIAEGYRPHVDNRRFPERTAPKLPPIIHVD